MYSRTFNGTDSWASDAHLVEGLPWVQVSVIINIGDVIITIGQAKVITPLLKSDVEILVQEMESDPLLLICIGHQTNIMQESNKKLKHHVFICLTSLINKMVQPCIIVKQIEIIGNT